MTLIEYHSETSTGDLRAKPVDAPLPVQTTAPRFSLLAATMVKLRGSPSDHGPTSEPGAPLHTIGTGGNHALAAVYLAQHNAGFNKTPGHPASYPLSSVSARGSQQQIVAASLAAYYGTAEDGQSASDAARTVTTKARFGWVESRGVTPGLTPEQLAGALRVAAFLRAHGVQFEGEFASVEGYVIVEIGMRMLTPRELFRAQGFGDEYVIDRAWVKDPKTGEIVTVQLTKEQQIRMCGNSVCPQVMAAIVRANVPELAVNYRAPR